MRSRAENVSANGPVIAAVPVEEAMVAEVPAVPVAAFEAVGLVEIGVVELAEPEDCACV